MKILFVCRGNVARSQMAEKIYNDLTRSHDAESAGTHVELEGETLADRKKRIGRSFVVDVMNENGMSFDHQKQTQLTKEMVNDFDIIVSMAGKKYTPKWLSESNKYIYWKIRDPKAVGHSTTNKTRLRIESEVQQFIKQYK